MWSWPPGCLDPPITGPGWTCARLSHSISSGRPGTAPRTARIAAAIPPAAATWLSFTSVASPSPARHLTRD